MTVPDDLVEHALLRDQITLFFGDKGAGLAQFDRVLNPGVAFIFGSSGISVGR
jgi:hypothetical protein